MRYLALLLGTILLSSCDFLVKTHSEENNTYQLDNDALVNNGLSEFFSWSEDRIPLISAHRGGPYPGCPENSLEAFEHISDQMVAVIECDIAMTKDSVLIMMHDYTLDRTTNGSGEVSDHLWREIEELRLVDNAGNQTDLKVPTLHDVLSWGKGKALFTLDVKRGVPFRMVVDEVVGLGMVEYAAIISYNANDAALLHKLNAELMISVGIGNQEAYEAHKALGVPDQNMIAFVGVKEPGQEHYEMLHEKGISTILGVLGNLDKKAEANGDELYADFVRRGADVLATDRPLEAAKAIRALWPKESEKYKYLISDRPKK